MATTNNRREIELALAVTTTGADALGEIGDDLRTLGTGAKQADPALAALAASLEEAAAKTKALRDAETTAQQALRAGQQALQAQKDALTLLRLETDAATKKTDEYATKVQTSRRAIFDAERSLRDLRSAYEEARTSATQAAQAQARIEQAMTRQAQATAGAVDVTKTLRGELDQLRTVANAAGAVLGGQILGGMAGDLARTADGYANLAARIKLVTGEGQASEQALRAVFEVAQRTNTAVEATGTLFTRLMQAGRELKLGMDDALRITEAVNQATQLSGASAEASDAAITQLIQGLQSGVLRGEELSSVLEQAPRLAQAMADGLAVTTGELRKMGEAGKLTAATVIGALQGQAAVIESEFSKLPPTIGRALTNLSTSWTAYVGQVDAATGASATAAGAINALARNLDTLGALLLSAGKAAAAYKALDLAALFWAKAAAVGADTAATTANTAATVANTAAKRANAAATTEAGAAATASAGRLAGAINSIKTFALVAVLTNLREIGTAIGESLARWTGYGKALDQAEASTRALDAAARDQAAAMAAQAQQLQIAKDKALGLTAESRKLVDEFDGLRAKGETVADALDKLTKALRLDNLDGITTAGTALDALAQKGTLSAEHVRDAWQRALKGIDLGVFETEARAAFGTGEEGARRLALALDGSLREALARTGTSFTDLSSGMGAAARSAVNDLDVIGKGLDRLRATGADTGQVLANAIGRAINAADTGKAVDAVRVQIQGLRQALGDKLADGFLEQANQRAIELRDNLDKLRPTINSLREAYRQLGVSTAEDLGKIAATNRAAWDMVKQDGTASANTLRAAFGRYAQSALDAAAATGEAGKATTRAALEGEAAAKGLRVEFDQAGRVIVRSALDGAAAIDKTTEATTRGTEAVQRQAEEVRKLGDSIRALPTADGFAKNKDGSAAGTFTNTLPTDQAFALVRGEITDPSAAKAAFQQAQNAYAELQALLKLSPGAAGLDYQKTTTDLYIAARAAFEKLTAGAIGNTPKPATVGGGNSYTVNVNLGGTSTRVNVASQSDATTLTNLLGQLQAASKRAI